MYDLFTRTISQGLQAFLPIAFCATWLRRFRAKEGEPPRCRGGRPRAVDGCPFRVEDGQRTSKTSADAPGLCPRYTPPQNAVALREREGKPRLLGPVSLGRPVGWPAEHAAAQGDR